MIEAKSILHLGNGAVLELADNALEEIIANIQDPNTDHKLQRKIVIEIKFRANEERSKIEVSASAKTNIAPNKPINVTMFTTVHKDKVTGEVTPILREVNGIPAGQMNLLDNSINKPEVIRIGKSIV